MYAYTVYDPHGMLGAPSYLLSPYGPYGNPYAPYANQTQYNYAMALAHMRAYHFTEALYPGLIRPAVPEPWNPYGELRAYYEGKKKKEADEKDKKDKEAKAKKDQEEEDKQNKGSTNNYDFEPATAAYVNWIMNGK